MKIIHSLVPVILCSLLFTSCATQNLLTQSRQQEVNTSREDTVFAYNPHYAYQLRKDDKINISVWDNDDISVGSVYGIYNSNEVYGKWLMLDDSGYVAIPKLGNVNLLGLTVAQVKVKLQNAFKKWIVNPVIDVKVLNKEVTVLGELKTPGKYTLDKENNTLLEVIGKAGDFDFYANKKKIQVIRMVDSLPVAYTVNLTDMQQFTTANVQIHPGDIVYVPSRRGKHWDKRAGSTIVPIASAISSAVLLGKVF
ncbi:polysaccharide export outer membrane protein [Filimonas lacunae]|uniref:Polysaccharide export outer membrane protein n=1 Tax=Filimonas lacunae TaxID=477680 RepID=A0A173MGZ8_9BACT|nr:polysaccharide biosynthesis/export family protein [Filimonas lacunae]BAV06892.1 polysaccharide export outer membrane protein [Filimonas lacunae]SIS98259.1 polysaccharide export outer membrane protein [Filimonas lacunae]